MKPRLLVALAAFALSSGLGFGVLAGDARADGPGDEAAAEALFNEARTLIDAGRVAEGCTKLEASQALDPGTGTLLHLADCYEKTGRTATAWARFREAAARAARDGRTDWESIAKTRAGELEPKLARLRIDAPAGVTVRRDGAEIPTGALGTALPIDPGTHVVEASAAGKKPWRGSVDAVAARSVTVTVPPLGPGDAKGSGTGTGPATGEGSNTNVSAPGRGSSLRVAGYVTGGAGIVGLGIGAAFGLAAISLNNRSKDVCPSSGICADGGARDDADSARSAATVSTIGVVAGGVLLATGVTLLVLAPRPTSAASASGTSASARVRVGAGSAFLEGTW